MAVVWTNTRCDFDIPADFPARRIDEKQFIKELKKEITSASPKTAIASDDVGFIEFNKDPNPADQIIVENFLLSYEFRTPNIDRASSILTAIWNGLDLNGQDRVMDAMDAQFLLALEVLSYSDARQMADDWQSGGLITADDLNVILKYVPEELV